MLDRTVDDDRIMLRLQSGDAAAFDEVFRRYYRHVYRIVAAIVHDDACAEDLTQTIFLKLWAAPESFRTGSLVAWLSRVGRNRALDELRHRRILVELPEITYEGKSPYDYVKASFDHRSLQAAVAALAVEHRSLIELSFFAGMTHAQIAHQTSIPLGAVKTRLRAGLRALRGALDGSV